MYINSYHIKWLALIGANIHNPSLHIFNRPFNGLTTIYIYNGLTTIYIYIYEYIHHAFSQQHILIIITNYEREYTINKPKVYQK